jgi:hypothetical protein
MMTTSSSSFEKPITQSDVSDMKEDTMNASPTTRTISARWLHSSIVIGSTLLIVAAIAIVLTFRSLSGATPAARSIPAALDSYAPLDQHERHSELPAKYGGATDPYERRSELFMKYGAATDPYERHPDLFALTAEPAAALDQHERHPDLFALTAEPAAALDQHERHPDLLAPKAENVALPDTLDRYLAAHSRP